MADILLTYIVPVYNTEPYLPKCLHSLVNQGLDKEVYEVLVVDDGSSDGSKAVVEAFAAEHPQVRLISQPNAGVSAARNKALDSARGRYVQFVDSDDYLEAGAMAPLLQRAVDEDLDVLMFNFKWVDGDGRLIKVSHPRDGMETTPAMPSIDYLSAYPIMQYVCWYIVRLDLLNRLNLRFNTSLIACEDGALAAEFMLHVGRVAFSQAEPYCYVSRGDSAMNNTDAAHLRRRIFSQVDAAGVINAAIGRYQAASGKQAPASISGLRNLYLYFSMTKALACDCVDAVVERMRQAGMYPFPCIGPEVNYLGAKWKVLHALMVHPRIWKFLSVIYRWIKKS